MVYLSVISVCSLVLGWLVNEFYAWANLDISQWVTSAEGSSTSWWGTAAAVVLAVCVVQTDALRSMLRRRAR